MTQDTFYEPVYVKGHRRRWEADVDWTAGPASARAEYTLGQRRPHRSRASAATDLADARAQVLVRVRHVGADRRAQEAAAEGGRAVLYGAESARSSSRSDTSGCGSTASELGGRGVPESARETIFPSGDRALTLGVNWTLNRFVKIQVNGIREHLEDPERNPVPNGGAFWSRVLRLQFVL